MTGCKCRECVEAVIAGRTPRAHVTHWRTPCHGFQNGCDCPHCLLRAGTSVHAVTGSFIEACDGSYTCSCGLCVAERVVLMRKAQNRAA